MTDLIYTSTLASTVTRKALLSELEAYEHLMFEPMTQADLDSLYALYSDWQQRLGDSPQGIAVCVALEPPFESGSALAEPNRTE